MARDDIQTRLFELRDKAYRDFHSRLMPDYDPEKIIGIRIPVLRSFAKDLTKEEKAGFIKNLPHDYYEENNLHAFIIEGIKDFDECIYELNRFLPYVDNWATCDSLRPKCFKNHKDKLFEQIQIWIKSDREFTVRFAIEMLMVHFLEKDFDQRYPTMVATVENDKYYVKMMIAWYFATALAKQWDAVIPYITQTQLSEWVHNKAIQKACESYRISNEKKEYLKMFKS